ncbi:MAG: hypothetical protein MUF34_14540 [Polyangiaceae bacterium]|nr:hypothetical protein [Polyangiaceae bacterium]
MSEIPAARVSPAAGATPSSIPPADPGMASSGHTLAAFARGALPEPIIEALSEPTIEALSEPALEALSEPALEALSEPTIEAASEPALALSPGPERASDEVFGPARPSYSPPASGEFGSLGSGRATTGGFGRRTLPPPAPRPARRSLLPTAPREGAGDSGPAPSLTGSAPPGPVGAAEGGAAREALPDTEAPFGASSRLEPAPSTVLTEPVAIPRRLVRPAGSAPRPLPQVLSSLAKVPLAPRGSRHEQEAPPTPQQRLTDGLNGAYALFVSTAVLTYLWVELYVRHAHVFLKGLAPSAPDAIKGLLSFDVLVACSPAVVICALPSLLSYTLIASGQRSLDTRLAFDVPGGPSSLREAGLGAAFLEARRRWRHEKVHVASARRRTEQNGQLYGFLVSLSLSLCAMVAARQVLFGEAPSTQTEKVALAVATALLITFARDVGRMAVRVANRDASGRMLAWNIKRLLMTVVGTLLLSGFAFAGSLPDALQGPAGWLLIGGGMALFADQVMEAVGERFAAVFGIKRPPPSDAENLRRLDGMGEGDLERLGEEGIDSIHALAMCSTAKLFFNTPYALQRICDWQDQALLVVRLGEPKARFFREQLQLRGAIDAQRLAADFLGHERLDEKERQDLVKMLGFPSDAQARMVLERLACDDMIRQLACYRKALPVDVDANDAPNSAP